MSGIFHMMFNKIASAIQQAFAVDLDGTNDYFSRSSDLTGNADGKTFTFSAWVWKDDNVSKTLYNNFNNRMNVACGGGIRLFGRNAANTIIFDSAVSSVLLPDRTFSHILVSIDLANTSNRYVFLNDVDITSSFTWPTYSNDSIDFTDTSHYVGDNGGGTTKIKGRLAHVFLAYEYVDLSVTANRRIFITADRKPA